MNPQLFKWLATPPDPFPYEANQPHSLLLITGDSGMGKTTWCQQGRDLAQAHGWRVGGLLSIPVMAGVQKVAIDLLDVATGEQRPFAKLSHPLGARTACPPPDHHVTTGRWLFDPSVLTWGNEVLSRITAVDLLIIDELGPLEFEQRGGLQAAFDLIAAGDYRMAAVVIRPSLIPRAQRRWPEAKIVSVSRGGA